MGHGVWGIHVLEEWRECETVISRSRESLVYDSSTDVSVWEDEMNDKDRVWMDIGYNGSIESSFGREASQSDGLKRPPRCVGITLHLEIYWFSSE